MNDKGKEMNDKKEVQQKSTVVTGRLLNSDTCGVFLCVCFFSCGFFIFELNHVITDPTEV